MTRLFGCICNQPQRVVDALAPVRASLVAAPPVSRWGLGYMQSGEVLLSRNPRRAGDDGVDLFAKLDRFASDYIIAHASADDGLGGNANTQPFRFRQWMFAQEGAIERADQDAGALAARAALRAILPEYLARNAIGQTAAEIAFYAFLARLRDSGRIDTPEIGPGRVRDALVAAQAQVRDAIESAGVSHDLGNLAMCNGRSLWVARLDTPVFLRRLTVPAEGKRPSTFRGVLAVSAAQNPGEGFEEIPPRSLLTVSRDVIADVSALPAP